MEEVINSSLPKHILLVRTSAMGDVAMLPHAIRAFKKKYPEVKITVGTRKLFEPFFYGLDVDFLFIKPEHGTHGITEMYRFAREARRLGIDAVADTHSVLRSWAAAAFLIMHGIKISMIRKGKIEKWFRLGYSKDNAVPLKHTVVRYCDTLRRLGFEFDDPEPLNEKPDFPNPFGEKKGLWVGFAPFSAHAGKTYPEDMREEVVRLLSQKYDRVFIHSGGGAEEEFATNMEAKYENVTSVFARLKLKDEMSLISHLDCVVSMDSLVMHLCSLTATPVVSVWGATHPEFGFLGYGTDPKGVLQKEMDCRPCSIYGKKPCKYGDVRCIRAIKPEMIAAKVAEIIGD